MTIFRRKTGWLFHKEIELADGTSTQFALYVTEGRECTMMDLDKQQLAEVLNAFRPPRTTPIEITVPYDSGCTVYQRILFRKWVLPFMNELAELLLEQPRVETPHDGPYR